MQWYLFVECRHRYDTLEVECVKAMNELDHYKVGHFAVFLLTIEILFCPRELIVGSYLPWSGIGTDVDPEWRHRWRILAKDEGGRHRKSGAGAAAHRRHGSLLGGAAGHAERESGAAMCQVRGPRRSSRCLPALYPGRARSRSRDLRHLPLSPIQRPG